MYTGVVTNEEQVIFYNFSHSTSGRVLYKKGNSLRKPRHFWEMMMDTKAQSAAWTCRWVGGERKKEAMRRKSDGAIEVSGEEKTKRTDFFFLVLVLALAQGETWKRDKTIGM